MIQVAASGSTTPDTVFGSAVVAALIAAVVSLVINRLTAVRSETLRRRELLAEAFQACIAYKEFPFRIRRRRSDDPHGERSRLSNELSGVQERLAFFRAWTSLEGRSVKESFKRLSAELRRVAGPEISRAWKMPPAENDEQVGIRDIDLSALEPFENAFLEAARGRVGTFTDRVRTRFRKRQN